MVRLRVLLLALATTTTAACPSQQLSIWQQVVHESIELAGAVLPTELVGALALSEALPQAAPAVFEAPRKEFTDFEAEYHVQHRTELVASLSSLEGSAQEQLLAAYDLGRFFPKIDEEKPIAGEYLVKWNSDCELPTWLNGVQHTYVKTSRFSILKGVGIELLLTALQDPSGCVKYIEQNSVVQVPPLTQSVMDVREEEISARRLQETALPWGIDFLDGQMTDTYEPGNKGAGVTIYVMDTGIDAQHPWLSPRVLAGEDFTGSASGTDDVQGHGTHCAGTAAGLYVGVAQEAELVPVKVLGDAGSGQLAWFVLGVDWVVEQPQYPKVMSMSLGAPISESIDEVVNEATHQGITVVAAAGNDDNPAGCSSPCRADRAICVGALTWDVFEQNVTAADYSNYGKHIDIWAPGTDVKSARSSSSEGVGLSVSFSGTSMACPHITGVVAQLLSKLIENGTIVDGETPGHMKDLMQTDCQVMYNETNGLKNSTGAVIRSGNMGDPWDGELVCTGFGERYNGTAWDLDGPCSNLTAILVLLTMLILLVAAGCACCCCCCCVALCCFCYFSRQQPAKTPALQMQQMAPGTQAAGAPLYAQNPGVPGSAQNPAYV